MDNHIRDISPWRRVFQIALFFLGIIIFIELLQAFSPNQNEYSFRFVAIALLICFLTGLVYTFVIYRRGQLIISTDTAEVNEWLDFHIKSLGYQDPTTNLRGIDIFRPEATSQLPASGPFLRYHHEGKIHLFGLHRQLEKLQNRLNRSSGSGPAIRSHFV